ncbi:MAG: ATP-binding protein [Clostridia bacterium]|nr:ATP-binding protein [Clostridia bacterium]
MYGYENFQKVKAELEAKRLAAIALADSRNEMLRATIPEIKEIDAELVKTGLLIFKTACDGGDLSPIRERNLALGKRRRELLKENGYPEDYTEIKYSCPACSDSGYADGKMCACMREALIKENIKSSGIGHLIDKQSFDNFSTSSYGEDSEFMESVLMIAKNYAYTFGPDSKNLVLSGKTGTGKTHISTAIARVVIERGFDVLYDSAQNIISAFEDDKFRTGYNRQGSSAEKYLDCDLLIIDDLGTEFTTQFTVSCLYNLLNTRLNKGLATVISTNLERQELERKYDDRLFSRIFGTDSIQLRFFGEDKRLNP